ncbi:hypothetical protein [Lactococcus formosensis]|uniref:hypothetical protein n=1 Tax=Lactococcus formosensis TaxID=1281486 RepID=UPI0031FE5EEF
MNLDDYVLNAIKDNLTHDEVKEWATNGQASDYYYRIVVDYMGNDMILDNSLVDRAWLLLHNIYVPNTES